MTKKRDKTRDARAAKVRQLEEICRRYHVDVMYAYGSRSKEIMQFVKSEESMEKEASSDADIGIRMAGREHLSVREKAELMIELEDLFEVNRVDLVILSEADPFLAANIVRGERVYCEDEHSGDEYDLYVLRRAGDLAPLERERLQLILGEER